MKNKEAKKTFILRLVVLSFLIVMVWLFIVGTVLPFRQVIIFEKAFRQRDPILVAPHFLEPIKFNNLREIAQSYSEMVSATKTSYEHYDDLIEKTIVLLEKAIVKSPLPNHILSLAHVYTKREIGTKNQSDIEKASALYKFAYEKYNHPEVVLSYGFDLFKHGQIEEGKRIIQSVYEAAPKSIHYGYYYAITLLSDELSDTSTIKQALSLFERALDGDFDPNSDFTIKKYWQMYLYFHKNQDKDNFLTVGRRLKLLDTGQSNLYEQVEEHLQKTGRFPNIQIETE